MVSTLAVKEAAHDYRDRFRLLHPGSGGGTHQKPAGRSGISMQAYLRGALRDALA